VIVHVEQWIGTEQERRQLRGRGAAAAGAAHASAGSRRASGAIGRRGSIIR
jgi:hypothetical protein